MRRFEAQFSKDQVENFFQTFIKQASRGRYLPIVTQRLAVQAEPRSVNARFGALLLGQVTSSSSGSSRGSEHLKKGEINVIHSKDYTHK